ncbi:hypothetical protein N7449_007026 [Penicillium cf. viridicatum]|uniref:Uncharacterized protein n=1 Tax=Penicillium cf. viridicatum TaxID=2972119 RepID=A0A9W9JHM7_9EURO|nr:hypothetical protein N7449_007026 [Penicillium cf. viridicatum]
MPVSTRASGKPTMHDRPSRSTDNWESPTTTARELLQEFHQDLTTDFDDIDALSRQKWVLQKFDVELNTPESRQIIRMYEDATAARREYEQTYTALDASLHTYENDDVRFVLRRLLDKVRLPPTDGGDEPNEDNNIETAQDTTSNDAPPKDLETSEAAEQSPTSTATPVADQSTGTTTPELTQQPTQRAHCVYITSLYSRRRRCFVLDTAVRA